MYPNPTPHFEIIPHQMDFTNHIIVKEELKFVLDLKDLETSKRENCP
jgi:hypothetical protein